MGIFINGITDENLFQKVKERVAQRQFVSYAEIAEYVSGSLPETKEAIIASANEALEGLLVLPGTDAKPYFVGNPPLWYENPVNDEEYVWLLNRMAHWKTLMQAYFLTGDLRYSDKVIAELNNWIDTCKRLPIDLDLAEYSRPVTPWRSLETGIRMYRSWPWIMDMLFEAELMTPALLGKFVTSVNEHCEQLYEICPRLFPNADHNHYFMEMLGLMYGSAMLPELKNSEKWTRFAIGELVRCANNQFTDEGGQLEGCPHYHNVCVTLLRRTMTGAQKYGLTLPGEFMNKARLAVDYALHSQRPSGTIVPWGDSDADTTSIRSAVDGYLMFGDRSWIDLILQTGCAETLKKVLAVFMWDEPKIISVIKDKDFFTPRNTNFPTFNWQKQLHQVMMRTGWDRDALSVFFACRTPVNNEHAHIDPMGFDFTAYGKPLIVDPGRYCYRQDEDRKTYKSAEWHNVLTVNNKSPFEYISSWEYGPQKEGIVYKTENKDGLMAAYAMQRNFEPVIHQRVCAIVEEKYLLIVDRLDGLAPDDTVQLYFHVDAEQVKLSGNQASSDGVHILFDDGLSATVEPGTISDALDVQRPSSRLILQDSNRRESTRIYITKCVPTQNVTDQMLAADYTKKIIVDKYE